MTRHPYLSNADGPDRGDVARRWAGSGPREIRPLSVHQKTGTGKYLFVPQVVDNLLNNELHVQAGLVPTNT
jgi:hypothetical protein